MICDRIIPELIYEKAVNEGINQKELEEGFVRGANPSDTIYGVSEDNSFDFLGDWLLESGLIPVLPDHDVRIATRFHRMKVGGKMTWHHDSSFSVAASVYLSECSGGELEVQSKCNTQTLCIKPIPNRIVVLKCDNMHRVKEVLGGCRDSVQVFYTFTKRN